MPKDTIFASRSSLNIAGNLWSIEQPKIMGILNVTPDSFFDGNQWTQTEKALKNVFKMVQEGMDCLDIGAQSTRPNAVMVGPEEEWKRMKFILKEITREFPKLIISVDTFHAEVAEKAIKHGAHMINDISGGLYDERMVDVVAEARVPYIMMHIEGSPKQMHEHFISGNIVDHVIGHLSERISAFRDKGVNDLIVDPGFGFSKTTGQNFELFNHLKDLEILNEPILVGISRKSMIYKTLGVTADEALIGTTALNMAALERGANFLRVHDVKEAVQVRELYLKMTTFTS